MLAATHFTALRKCVTTQRSGSGFTLLELLVVIVIIGIITSVASISVNVLGRDNQIEEQAKRLNAVISQVREESEMQARDVGLFIERDGYLFMRFDARKQTWAEINDDQLLARRQLPGGLQNRLWLEGREVILKTHDELTDLNKHAATTADKNAVNSSGSKSKDTRVPQIAILSSGDLSPFELRIERKGTTSGWHLLGKPDNTLTVEMTDAQK